MTAVVAPDEREDLRAKVNALSSSLVSLRSSLVSDDLAAILPWSLSPIERRIFGMLLSQDVVTKQTIILLLHGRSPSSADLKNVDVFISRIRSKTAASGVTIHTIFGVGYRLEGRESWRTSIRDSAGARH